MRSNDILQLPVDLDGIGGEFNCVHTVGNDVDAVPEVRAGDKREDVANARRRGRGGAENTARMVANDNKRSTTDHSLPSN